MFSGNMGTTTHRKNKLGTSTAFLARPRLGALKNVYSGGKNFGRPMGLYGMDKKKKVKKSTTPKMEFRKKPDYADTAYREAVTRLRILLAESYVPMKLDSAGEETDNQSLLSGISKTSRYPHYHSSALTKKYPYYTLKSPAHYTSDDRPDTHTKADAPPELMAFIERQEDYIDQLERESRFCRDELSGLLSKVKDVISENETLHEKQKNNLMKSVFDQFKTETETEIELDIGKARSPKKLRKQRVLEGPAIVFESRISELEAQLTQTKIDLKKAQEESDALRKKIGDGPLSDGFESTKKQIENLQREKAILQDTVAKLQTALNLFKDKEHNTNDQVKRSLDVAEQAQYEKSAAEHEIRRLKDELERQHGKLRDAISEQSRRVADERNAVERRYSQQIEQLTAELGVHWEQNSKHQLELDKQRRENNDLRRELAQKQALIDELKKEMQNKIITLQSDIGVSGAEKSALEQQIASLNMANERCERQAKQEAMRLQAEMQSLRQRLDRADADLIHSRRENLRLNEQIAALEKEINMNAALAEEKKKREKPSEIIALPPPKEKKEVDMGTMIKDMEAKHVATVAELEGMIQSQNQLMDKLSAECHALTQKLEESSMRHKEEIRELHTNLDYLTSRFSQSQNKPSLDKDETNSTPRIAQHETSHPPEVEKPAHDLIRTSSKSSIPPQAAENLPNSEPINPSAEQYYSGEPQQTAQEYTENTGDIQQYADPNMYDPQQYPEQMYDPNQEYMTQEQYDQQYGQYDPNMQYENEGYTPNYETQQYEQQPEETPQVSEPTPTPKEAPSEQTNGKK